MTKDRTRPVPLTKAEIEQLLTYCHDWGTTSYYYGDQKQFWDRHDNIVEILSRCIDVSSKPVNRWWDKNMSEES